MTRLGLVCAGAVALSTVQARAQPQNALKHKVRKGDTLELLAAEYYGDRRHAVFIMVANNISHPRALKRGERIRILVGPTIVSSEHDTLKSLADQYLGDPRRAEFLATFNGLAPDATLPAGEEIYIPFHVKHTAAQKERLSSIAATYLGSSKQASLLRRYNFITRDTLEKGESIVVPIQHVRVRKSRLGPPDKESVARRATRRKMQAAAADALPQARRAWRNGNYARVKRLLAQIEVRFLDTELLVKVGVLLGSAYIALGDSDTALRTFKHLRERNPKYKLSRFEHSPKVRGVWKRAGGEVAEDPR